MKNKKIEKYHFEEIILILLILKSELSNYDKDDLKCFSESIEGRIEVLFKKDFLFSLNREYGINNDIAFELEKIKNLVVKLYESNWIEKLLDSNQEINLIRQSSSKILDDLKVRENDPKKFSEDHLNIDW